MKEKIISKAFINHKNINDIINFFEEDNYVHIIGELKSNNFTLLKI